MTYRYFELSDFACKETGENLIDTDFVFDLDCLRHLCGFPLTINSGYRSPRHSIEAAKEKPGTHTTGKVADVKCTNVRRRYILQKWAYAMGFSEISVGPDFIHLGKARGIGQSWTYYD